MVSWNTDEWLAKFREMEYSNLTDTFRDAIQKSLDILKSATLTELHATGYNVTGPVRSHGRKYPSLASGVIAETAVDGTKGRVRIAPASKQGYHITEQSSHALKWFEIGTKPRYRKPAGKYKAKDEFGNTHIYKREVGEGFTGSIGKSGFFNKALTENEEIVNDTLSRNVMNALEKIWNR